MRGVYPGPENAIQRLGCVEVVGSFPYYESHLGTIEATTLRDLLAGVENRMAGYGG